MNRETIIAKLAKLVTFYNARDYEYVDGRAVALSFGEEREGSLKAAREALEIVKREPLGPDEWRVPPDRPNPHGLPVEDLPNGPIRVWMRGGEYTAEGPPEDVGDDLELWIKDLGDGEDEDSYVSVSEIEAWRPAAVGPGGGA